MRLDAALVARGLARSRGRATDLIAAGRVLVNGRPAQRPAQQVTDAENVSALVDPWVSRAAHKLLGALEASGTGVSGRVLDAGASTGGFTQVLLQRDAARVYAVDVGHGQLVPEVADDPRVVVREGLNLRDLSLDDVEGHPVDLVVADVSFISLTLLVEPLRRVAADGATALVLVKPQFEVGRGHLDSRGVVADPRRAAEAVDAVAAAAAASGWGEVWRGPSTLPGESGNTEHFLKWVALPGLSVRGARVDA